MVRRFGASNDDVIGQQSIRREARQAALGAPSEKRLEHP